MNSFVILKREQREVNTDPQRRCYNGCHAKSELIWGSWEEFDYPPTKERAEFRLKFWRELNDEAISGRGEGARNEYKIVEC